MELSHIGRLFVRCVPTSAPLSLFLILILLIVPLVSIKTPEDETKNLHNDCKDDDRGDSSYVCGSNGITYSNENAIRCANYNGSEVIKIVFSGKCEDVCWQAVDPKRILQDSDQVCDTDGFVYPSAQVFQCINQHSGNESIKTVECDTQSTYKTFDPCLVLAYVTPRKICASDNVTYNNIWHMVCTANMYDIVDLKMEHEGECNIECPYSPIYNPVCSTLEYMFANVEALQCRRLLSPYIKNDFHHHGHCARHLSQNPCYVDNAYNAVCASNGRTYTSPKYVRCLKESNPELSVLHSGTCSVEEVEKILGPTEACALSAHHYEWNPICGNDNVTYGNPFRFLCNTLNNTKDLLVAYKGECGRFDYCRLQDDDGGENSGNEMCGNDGVTYKNINSLYCMQTKKRHLQLSHAGRCTPKDDPCLYRGTPFLDNNGTPVCASNGVTYVTPQAIWCAAKTDQGIEFKHDGECF